MAEFSFLLMVEQCSSVYAFATSFLSIYSLANTDCFHVLTFMNNAAVNMRVHYILKLVFSFILDKYSEVELLDHLIVLFLSF